MGSRLYIVAAISLVVCYIAYSAVSPPETGQRHHRDPHRSVHSDVMAKQAHAARPGETTPAVQDDNAGPKGVIKVCICVWDIRAV